MTFEEYLKKIHAKNYHGTDDNMPDSFEAFIVDLQIDEVIEYADEWHAQELKSISRKGANTTNSKYTTEQKSEWGKKGGRPKKNLQ